MAASGWLATAAANWLQREAVIGGIYHRPLVVANLIVYFVGGASLIPNITGGAASAGLIAICLLALLMAAIYAYLLRKGPLPKDMPG